MKPHAQSTTNKINFKKIKPASYGKNNLLSK